MLKHVYEDRAGTPNMNGDLENGFGNPEDELSGQLQSHSYQQHSSSELQNKSHQQYSSSDTESS